MKSAWSSALALLAVAAAARGYDAVAGPIGTDAALASTNLEGLSITATILATAGDTSSEAWTLFRSWLGESYERAPALMLGLILLLAVPPLALAGFFVRRTHRSVDATTLILPRGRHGATRQRSTTALTELSAWPTEAWVEVEGMPEERHVIGRTLVRIGREMDNDIHLSANTVHRYHAVIRRTTDGDVVITDLSGEEGNGVLINGKRITEAKLTKGDRIAVGEIRLRFNSRPI